MPEASEVRLNVDFLNRTLKDQEIKNITLNSGRFLKKVPKGWHTLMLELGTYTFAKVTKIKSKGKMIYGSIQFTPNVIKYFSCSLAMTGSWTDKDQKHNHLTFHLRNGKKVHFNDPRCFGNIVFYNKKEELDEILDTLGVDFFKPLTNELIKIIDRLKKIKDDKQVCEVLMNQSIFCGVGNYIKNEVLFKLKIHPATKWNTLKVKNQIEIFHECYFIIRESYQVGGASFKTFKNEDGKLAGTYQNQFQIYGKKNLKDGFPVSKDQFNDGRTSFFDPRVQKLLI